jgi:hypothetical protein
MLDLIARTRRTLLRSEVLRGGVDAEARQGEFVEFRVRLGISLDSEVVESSPCAWLLHRIRDLLPKLAYTS